MSATQTPSEVRWKFTVDDVTRMLGAGILDEDDRVELIEGELFVRSSQDPPHAGTVGRITSLLVRAYASTCQVRVQLPLVASKNRLPEPDFAIVRGRLAELDERHPRGDEAVLVVEVTVASVYTIEPLYRTPEDIVRDLDADEREVVPRPRPEHKRVWASVTKEPAEVIEEMFEEAERRDPEHRKVWIALVDGNVTQLRLIKETAARRGVKIAIQLDVIHVIEYLWRAAYCFHEDGTPVAEAWVTGRLLEVLRGKSSDVAAGIRRSATLRGLERAARAAADDCADYLLKYRAHLDYDVALAAGLPIATGVIEGACRYLVKDRMDITGARWGLAGAEAILCLRALRASGDFDDYWTFHERREYARHHAARYAGPPPQTIVPLRPSRHRPPTLRLVP